jgi:anti-sigma regulatory factor (Ser/Thr protein kinase)
VTKGVGAQVLEPRDHVVNFYDDDHEIVSAAAQYAAEGLNRDEAVILVATEAHMDAIEEELAAYGIDAQKACGAERLYRSDAADLLSRFMVGGRPDPDRFRAVVGGLIADASAGGRPVRAFGEMVALLWEQGNEQGAIELEALWNALANERSFFLYCAYPIGPLIEGGDLTSVTQVCEHHSNVIAPLSYTTMEDARIAVDGSLERTQVFVPARSAIAAVRRFVTDTLNDWGEAGLNDDALIVVSELATNAVRHASSAFRASIRRGEGVVRIAIHDVRQDLPSTSHPRSPIDGDGGLGITVVERLSARWGVDLLHDGKVVWSELDTPRAT